MNSQNSNQQRPTERQTDFACVATTRGCIAANIHLVCWLYYHHRPPRNYYLHCYWHHYHSAFLVLVVPSIPPTRKKSYIQHTQHPIYATLLLALLYVFCFVAWLILWLLIIIFNVILWYNTHTYKIVLCVWSYAGFYNIYASYKTFSNGLLPAHLQAYSFVENGACARARVCVRSSHIHTYRINNIQQCTAVTHKIYCKVLIRNMIQLAYLLPSSIQTHKI